MTANVAVSVAEMLGTRGETLAVAESSTGGLILSLLTDVPGASRWLRGGLVAYTNDAKRDLLGVSEATLSTHGAVSAEAALEMARGAARLFGSVWALSETGVAGPQTGRRSAKPAGLTFIAVVGMRDGHPIARAERRLLPTAAGRSATKRAFAEAALALLLDALQQ
jgi:nicotinamide-nucleotide amidase